MSAIPTLLSKRPRAGRVRSPRRGATLAFGLIALLVLLIGAAAVVRSMNASMFNTGNLSFKRDLTNQAERAAAAAMTLLQSGALAAESARQNNLAASNYSATLLPSNAQGIPTVLLANDTTFAASWTAADTVVAGQAVTLRWVLDRMCVNTGAADESHCTMTDAGTGNSDSFSQRNSAQNASGTGLGALQRQVVYRLSIRASGPRNTQSFLQTTFTL
jgi:type IV pilus assembly protein PilX